MLPSFLRRRRDSRRSGSRTKGSVYIAEACEPRLLLAAIASDQTVTGTIASAGQVDAYTFTAAAGQAVYAAVAETVPGSALTVSIELRGPTNALIDSSSSASGTNVFATNLAAGGTYTINVTGAFNTTGAYALTLAQPGTAPQAGTDAGPITSAAYRTAAIGPGDIDVHTISGVQGGSLLVDVGDLGPASGFDPEIIVFSPTGAQLNSSASATGTALLITNLPATGTYYVTVADQFNDETGSYGLSVATFGGAQASDADSGPIDSGGRRTGTIDPGDFDVYTISAVQNGSLLAGVGDLGPTSGFDPQVIVFSPTGAVLANDATATGTNVLLSNLPATGTYYVAVLDQFADETGSYGVSVARFGGSQTVSAGDQGGPLASGEYRTGTIVPGDFDVYTMSASAGNTLVGALGDAAAPGGPLSPRLIAFSPTGAVLFNDSGADGTSMALTNLPAAGTYALVVLDQFGNLTGDYGLSVGRFGAGSGTPTVSPGDEGGALTSAQRRLGRIAPGDIDTYTFDLAAGNGAFWNVGETVDNPFAPRLVIVGPTGNVLLNTFNARGRDFALPAAGAASAGVYSAIVMDGVGGTPGEYAMTGVSVPAVQAPDADHGSLAPGDRRAGALPPGDADVYTVAATAGQALTFNLSETSGPIEPNLIVYAPNGTIAGNQFGAASAQVVIPSAAAGTYTAVVEDAFADESGAYAIALNTTAGADTFAPVLLENSYRYADRPPRLRLAFSEDVFALFDPTNLTLENLTTGQTIDPADMSITATTITHEIYFDFSPLPGGVLPDGNYRLSIPSANLRDAATNAFAQDLSVDFFVLKGDADRDRTVGFSDLLALAKNYGQTFRNWAQGDFNYDGNVDFTDLLSLAKNYNKSLPVPAAVAAAPALTPAAAAPTAAPSVLRDESAARPVFSTTPVHKLDTPKPKLAVPPLRHRATLR